MISQGEQGRGVSVTRRFGLVGLVFAALLALTAAPALAAPPAEFGSVGEGAGEFVEPTGIGIDQQSGDSYVARSQQQPPRRFGPEGELLLALGWGVRDGAPEPQTCGPQATPPIATCQAGIAGTGPGQLANPHGIAVDNDPLSPSHGDVYVGAPETSASSTSPPANSCSRSAPRSTRPRSPSAKPRKPTPNR